MRVSKTIVAALVATTVFLSAIYVGARGIHSQTPDPAPKAAFEAVIAAWTGLRHGAA